MTDRLAPIVRIDRPKLSPAQAAHAERVRERNDWLQRGQTGTPPKAIYADRPEASERKKS